MKRSKENALMVLYAGEKMYRIAMPFVFILFGVLALLGLVCLAFVVAGESAALGPCFALQSPSGFLNAVFLVMLILIGLGLLAIPFFLVGFVLLGMGQIALNTLKDDKNQETDEETPYEPLSEELFGIDIPGLVTEDMVIDPEPFEQVAAENESKEKKQDAVPAEKPKFSTMVITGLRQAVESQTDDEMFGILEKVASRSRVAHEKQLIRQIMNRPTGKIRSMVDEVYEALAADKK